MRILPLIILFLAAFFGPFPQAALAEEKFSIETFGSILDQAGENTQHLAGEIRDDARVKPVVRCESLENLTVRKKCDAANIAYYAYFEFGMEHRKRVFAWQDISTKIIFAIVTGLVLVGMWFAWLQFERGSRHPSDPDRATHTIEIGTGGVKVSSPVLGVIILTLSLAFFYLYLVYVYPITDTI